VGIRTRLRGRVVSTLAAELTSEAKAPYTTSKIVRVSIKYPRIEGEGEING
jgi:hypothetical protein